MYKMLIVDDEPSICSSLEFVFEDDYEIYIATDYTGLIKNLEHTMFDIVLLDLKFGSIDGIEILKMIKEQSFYTNIIIMTAYSSVETSVDAMKLGAWDYVLKPLNLEELKILVERACDYKSVNEELINIKNTSDFVDKDYEIIGESKEIKHIISLINRVKDVDVNVLITGESGTGKELVAIKIHNSGNRRNQPLEIINCGAIPKELIESELFGHVKGAFTGAISDRKGKFQLADKGTLFLDEIGEMSTDIQVKLLRALETKVIYPVGSDKGIPIDVRIVSATNKNLKEEIALNNFREDIYYRLNVIEIEMPNLEKRKEDINLLIKHFVHKYSAKLNKHIESISPEAIDFLNHYKYKGNIRELENIIERAMILSENNRISIHDLPKNIEYHDSMIDHNHLIVNMNSSLEEIEKSIIQEVLKNHSSKLSASKSLGISERTLWNKIKKYNL